LRHAVANRRALRSWSAVRITRAVRFPV
jgi:hypothetical protein